MAQSRRKKTDNITLAQSRDMLYEKFRTNSRLLRAWKGWSAVQASKEFGFRNSRRLIDLEYGRGNPTMEEMIAISKVYGYSIDDILNKQIKFIFE